VTSANAAKLFNIYPQKGSICVGADADLVLWDPQGTKTISVKTQHSKVDFNVFEGRKVRGIPTHTVSQGRVVYATGDLRAERGVGRYIKRPAFGANFQAMMLRSQDTAPSAVVRPGPAAKAAAAIADATGE
jgi:dihydropyrimidinase